jgi:hypothetical protein
MLGQILATCGVVALALAGLVGSNLMYDRGWDSALSRRLASTLGGAAFLVAVLWLHAWLAIVMSAALTALIVALRFGFRRGLRGAKGSLPSQAWAAVTFALAGTVSLVVGWGVLGQKWWAFLPIGFMAWGDNAAGLVRDTVCRTRRVSIWPSLAMLGACLGVAAFLRPFWIGGAGAIVATLTERFRPRFLGLLDDNLIVVMVSLGSMVGMAQLLA